MTATVVITTRNRNDELKVAVKSALKQTANPQVLVIDDGSTDGTSEMILAEFPQVTLHRFETSKGLIEQRNNGAKLAAGDIIFSIDDDAAFSTPNVIQQTLAEFSNPRVGAVAIPFINVKKENQLFKQAPGETGIFASHDFVGTSYAVRRDLFLGLGGYHGFMLHQGEEQDFCIRMLDAGYIVALGRADRILHYESPRRDLRRMDLYGRRNDLLFSWYNVPLPNLLVHLPGTAFRGLMFGFKVGRPLRMLRGLGMGLPAIIREWAERKPVRVETFELMRRLKKSPLRLEEIEMHLPPRRFDSALVDGTQ